MKPHEPTQDVEQLEPVGAIELSLAFDIAEQMQPDDDEWSRLSNGELSSEQAVALAQAHSPDHDDEDLERMARWFAPPSASKLDKELEVVMNAFDDHHSESDGTSTVIPFPPRTQRVAGATAGLAAAAAVLLWLQTETPEGASTDPPSTSPEELPTYELEWDPFMDSTLGVEPGPNPKTPAPCDVKIHTEQQLSARLRPETAVDHAVEVSARAVSLDDGTALDLKLITTIEDNGFIAVRKPINELGLTPGDWTITFVIGTPGQLPDPTTHSTLEPGPHSGFFVLRNSVCVVQ